MAASHMTILSARCRAWYPSQLEADLEDLRKEHERAQAEVRAGRDELERTRAEVRAGKDELERTQAEVRAGKDELERAQAEVRAGKEELERTQAEVRAGREELERYQGKVANHFAGTSERLRELTLQYRAVYNHLAEGAGDLCPEGFEKLEDGLRLDALPEESETPEPESH